MKSLLLSLLCLVSAGCNLSSSETRDPLSVQKSLHVANSISLFRHFQKLGYSVKNDSKSETISNDHIKEFVETGRLPENSVLANAEIFEWTLDANQPEVDSNVPNTPWYYSQSALRGEWDLPVSNATIQATKNEWNKIEHSFPQSLSVAGETILEFAFSTLDDPDSFQNVPYVSIRDDENGTFAEYLAFADGYWLHLFITSWKTEDPSSIITITFTEYCKEIHAEPPGSDENLLSKIRPK